MENIKKESELMTDLLIPIISFLSLLPFMIWGWDLHRVKIKISSSNDKEERQQIMWQARKTRNKTFRKRRYFSCIAISFACSLWINTVSQILSETKNGYNFLFTLNWEKKYVLNIIFRCFFTFANEIDILIIIYTTKIRLTYFNQIKEF